MTVAYLTVDQVVELHAMALYATGGREGVLSYEGLASSVFAPQQSAFGEDAYPTVALKAAALAYFLTMNHAFEDGNKRTAMLAMDVFLSANDHVLSAPDDELAACLESLDGRRMPREEFFAWVVARVQSLETWLGVDE